MKRDKTILKLLALFTIVYTIIGIGFGIHWYKQHKRIGAAALKRGILFPSESGVYDFLSPKPIPSSLLKTVIELELIEFRANGMSHAKWPKSFRAYYIDTMYMSCEADQKSWGTNACDGVTFMPPTDEAEMYVRASEDECVTHTSLSHEVGHMLLGGDGGHENALFWGYSQEAILGRVYARLEALYCPSFKGVDEFYKRHAIVEQRTKQKKEAKDLLQ